MCFWLVEMLKKIGAQFGYLTPPNLHVYYPFVDFSKVHGYPDKINIGYAMKPRGLQPHGNLYKHPHMKCKGVYDFQGYLNPVGPESSSYKVYILYIANQIVSLHCNINCVVFLCLAMATVQILNE